MDFPIVDDLVALCDPYHLSNEYGALAPQEIADLKQRRLRDVRTGKRSEGCGRRSG